MATRRTEERKKAENGDVVEQVKQAGSNCSSSELRRSRAEGARVRELGGR